MFLVQSEWIQNNKNYDKKECNVDKKGQMIRDVQYDYEQHKYYAKQNYNENCTDKKVVSQFYCIFSKVKKQGYQQEQEVQEGHP